MKEISELRLLDYRRYLTRDREKSVSGVRGRGAQIGPLREDEANRGESLET
jgi:hypothetical protein